LAIVNIIALRLSASEGSFEIKLTVGRLRKILG
jgi:hypothetical protein